MHNLLHLLQMDYMLRKMLGWKLDTVYKSIKCQTFWKSKSVKQRLVVISYYIILNKNCDKNSYIFPH